MDVYLSAARGGIKYAQNDYLFPRHEYLVTTSRGQSTEITETFFAPGKDRQVSLEDKIQKLSDPILDEVECATGS